MKDKRSARAQQYQRKRKEIFDRSRNLRARESNLPRGEIGDFGDESCYFVCGDFEQNAIMSKTI